MFKGNGEILKQYGTVVEAQELTTSLFSKGSSASYTEGTHIKHIFCLFYVLETVLSI